MRRGINRCSPGFRPPEQQRCDAPRDSEGHRQKPDHASRCCALTRDFAHGPAQHARTHPRCLAPVGAEQKPVAEQVDQARHPVAVTIDSAHHRGRKQLGAGCQAGNLKPVSDVRRGFIPAKGFEVKTGRHALVQLPQLRSAQHRGQLGLSDQDNMQ